jgi:hypothetical protein
MRLRRAEGGGRVFPGHPGGLRAELVQPHSFLEGNGRVAVLIEVDLTGKATGKRLRDEEIHLMEFGSDGEMTGFRHFLDTAKAIEAHS